jgi:hypothetical protein
VTRTRAIFSVVAATVLLAASAAAQQGASGFSLGVGGGFAQAPDQGIGYTVFSTLEFPSPVSFLRPRVDAFLSNWAQSPYLTAITANVLLTPFATKSVAPYLLVGGGAYTEEGSRTQPGFTVGLGLRLPGLLRSVVVESQMHMYRLEHPRAGLYIPPGAIIEPSQIKRNRAVFKPIGIAVQF